VQNHVTLSFKVIRQSHEDIIRNKEMRQVLKSDMDVERLDDKRDARAEGGRRFHREGAITGTITSNLSAYMYLLANPNVTYLYRGYLHSQSLAATRCR